MSVSAAGQTPGVLYIVATPIGNLEDITYRAVRLLKEVDQVAAEDTRHSRKLLAHYGIETPLVSYHEHNEQQRSAQLIERLKGGACIALISDAGTPCIADPGYRLVRAAQSEGLRVVPVPGASALIAALSSAGLPTDRFAFEGYLPSRSGARAERLKQLKGEPRTQVFYEAPHRLVKSLADFKAIFGADRELVVARELTKLHEELYSGTVGEALAHFQEQSVKGEVVLVLAAARQAPRVELAEALAQMLRESDLSRREIVKMVAREYGVSSSEVYRISLKFNRDEAADEQES